jgi:flagellar protein FliO/FliZ
VGEIIKTNYILNYYKRLVVLSLVLFVSFSLFAADSNTKSTDTQTANEKNISDTQAQISSKKENDIILSDTPNNNNLANASGQSSNKQPSTLWLFIRMILVLIIVIVIIYALVYFLKRSGKNIANDDPYLKLTASLTVSAGKTVQVITLGNKAYLIGVSDTNVNLIAQIDDEDLINAMNLAADAEPAGKAKDFASMLAKFTHSVSESTSFSLKKQQNRLKHMSSHPEDKL